jgi:lysozyme
MTITPNVAQTLLLADIKEIEDFLSFNVACPLNNNEYSALICLIYNIGIDAFRRSKILRLLNAGKKADVPIEFMRWVHINRKVSKGLKTRRQAEKYLFLKV